MPSTQGRIPLPRSPQTPPPTTFPVLAFVAPIIAAALMWAFTRSPFVLMFAFLGPVVAVAAMGDARRRNRVDVRQQYSVFEQEYLATLRAIDAAHEQERGLLEQCAPRSLKLVTSSVRDSERWRAEHGEQLNVRLGAGRLASGVILEENPPARTQLPSEVKPAGRRKNKLLHSFDELRARVAVLNEAPVVVDARWGIGVCGPRAEVVALATSIAVQLAWALSPATTELYAKSNRGGTFKWVRGLPHFVVDSDSRMSDHDSKSGSVHSTQLSFRPRAGGAATLLCVADEEHALPHECRVVIFVSGSHARVVRHPDVEFPEHFVPDYVSDRQARRFAETLRRGARGTFAHWGQALPQRVPLSELIAIQHNERVPCEANDEQRGDDRNSLKATVGMGANGPVLIDLVTEGPHAIIGGTTGSGKSEVLATWVLALAARHTPADVTFLLVDFKGGAAFAPVQHLPHTVGVLTDLDPSAARRAILSLRAELRRREQILADAHVRSIAELPRDVAMPRLLIIVDEFAAMVTTFTEMHDLFADLAARGRSLGIHLILCTQRPAGTIREAVLANCTLRVSLRVNNSADSVAVIGTPDAASIPQHLPGRCLVQRGGSTPEAVQWAMASADDALNIESHSQGQLASVQRPWLDPLPNILERSAVPHVPPPTVAFGLSDIPEEQRQVAAVYDPVRDGNVLIMGSHHSGKSTVLSTLAATVSDAVVVPSSTEGAWDSISDTLSLVRAGTAPSLVLLDDLDLLIAGFSQEYESAFVDLLSSLLREGLRAGTTMALSASVVRGRVQSISSLCTSTLLLRMRDKHDHVLVGGDVTDFCAQLPAGGGFWQGHRVQVSFSEPLLPRGGTSPSVLECSPGEIIFVVSARPTTVRGTLERCGPVVTLDGSRVQFDEVSALTVKRGSEPTIVLGDPGAWLSSLPLLGSLRASCRFIFHDCSLTEFRSIAGIRELPPPLGSSHNTVVVLHPDGRMHRARLP